MKREPWPLKPPSSMTETVLAPSGIFTSGMITASGISVSILSSSPPLGAF